MNIIFNIQVTIVSGCELSCTFYTGKEQDVMETSFQNSMLKSLGKALTYISKDQLLNHRLPAKFVAGQKTNLPDNIQTLLNTFSPLLLFRARPVQITVYHMLNK